MLEILGGFCKVVLKDYVTAFYDEIKTHLPCIADNVKVHRNVFTSSTEIGYAVDVIGDNGAL